MSDQFLVVELDLESADDVHHDDDGDVASVTVPVVDGPFDDPHEAGFEARASHAYEIVAIQGEQDG